MAILCLQREKWILSLEDWIMLDFEYQEYMNLVSGHTYV